VRISRHFVVHLMLSWQLLHRLLSRPVDAACAPALFPAIVASGRAELLLQLLLALPVSARLDVLQRMRLPALGNTSPTGSHSSSSRRLRCALAKQNSSVPASGDHSAFWSDSSSRELRGAPLVSLPP